jgi:hypothetical protein
VAAAAGVGSPAGASTEAAIREWKARRLNLLLLDMVDSDDE